MIEKIKNLIIAEDIAAVVNIPVNLPVMSRIRRMDRTQL